VFKARILFLLCLSAPAYTFAGQAAPQNTIPPAQAKTIIAGRAAQVLAALQSKDMTKLAALVHPQKGLRFSPYADVNPKKDVVLKRDNLQTAWASKKRLSWGDYDGAGGAIRLAFRDYYRRFVYDHDFAKANRVSFNGELLGHGTTPNLIREVYPDAIVVERHFTGFDPKYDGMDWRSLWLVFEKKDGTWYLTGIVHGQWTT
jgi:hypothetical protein